MLVFSGGIFNGWADNKGRAEKLLERNDQRFIFALLSGKAAIAKVLAVKVESSLAQLVRALDC